MLKLPGEHRSGPVEVDMSELTPDEWFAIYAVRGLAPDANLDKIAEYQKRAFAMSPAQKHSTFRAGMESLIARGLFGPALNADGSPMTDEQGNIVYEKKGKLIYRVKSVGTPTSVIKS
jgi:hypothetical protein